MEQKTVSGKIPAELHARFRSEMEARGWTMSFALEQVINEHFENEKGRNNTMENTRTLAFAVSEEFFQLVKEYLAWYEEVYHRRLTQKQFIIGLIEDELERNAEALKARRNRLLSEQQAREDVLRLAEQYEAVSTDESDNEYREEAAEDEAETEYGEEAVPFPVSWTVKMKKKQKETQDILSYHSQAAGCSDKARAKASGGRQPIEECGRTGL